MPYASKTAHYRAAGGVVTVGMGEAHFKHANWHNQSELAILGFVFIEVVLIVLIVIVFIPVFIILVFFLFFFFFLRLGCGPAFGLRDALEVHVVPGFDVELFDVAVQILDFDEF